MPESDPVTDPFAPPPPPLASPPIDPPAGPATPYQYAAPSPPGTGLVVTPPAPGEGAPEPPPIVVHDEHPAASLSLPLIWRYWNLIAAFLAAIQSIRGAAVGADTTLQPIKGVRIGGEVHDFTIIDHRVS